MRAKNVLSNGVYVNRRAVRPRQGREITKPYTGLQRIKRGPCWKPIRGLTACTPPNIQAAHRRRCERHQGHGLGMRNGRAEATWAKTPLTAKLV
jgi:hypothetical protein